MSRRSVTATLGSFPPIRIESALDGRVELSPPERDCMNRRPRRRATCPTVNIAQISSLVRPQNFPRNSLFCATLPLTRLIRIFYRESTRHPFCFHYFAKTKGGGGTLESATSFPRSSGSANVYAMRRLIGLLLPVSYTHLTLPTKRIV